MSRESQMVWTGGIVEEAQSTAIEECWAEIDGVRMRYLRAGSGPPLVLVHGLLGYSFSWRFVIPTLAPHATVYAIDMLGAGFSERYPGLDCSFQGCADRLLRFASQVGLGSFDLLGTSHGGAVAMTAAGLACSQSCPSVRRLVLVAPVNPWSMHGRGLAKFLSGRIVSVLFRNIVPRARPVHSGILQRLYGDVSKVRPGTLEGYSQPLMRPGSFEYPLEILRTWGDDLCQLEASLQKIVDIPTLMIWGGLDRAVDPASVHTLCRYFRNCRVVEMRGVGHLPYEEEPDAFNELLIDFLTN